MMENHSILVDMGFHRDDALEALVETTNNVEEATELLMARRDGVGKISKKEVSKEDAEASGKTESQEELDDEELACAAEDKEAERNLQEMIEANQRRENEYKELRESNLRHVHRAPRESTERKEELLKEEAQRNMQPQKAATQAPCLLDVYKPVFAQRPLAAGYVFMCDNRTYQECILTGVFGAPARNFPKMQEALGAGSSETGADNTGKTYIFLWNKDDRILHGPFQALGAPQLNILRYAWMNKTRLEEARELRLEMMKDGRNIPYEDAVFEMELGEHLDVSLKQGGLYAEGMHGSKTTPFSAQLRVTVYEDDEEFLACYPAKLPNDFFEDLRQKGSRGGGVASLRTGPCGPAITRKLLSLFRLLPYDDEDEDHEESREAGGQDGAAYVSREGLDSESRLTDNEKESGGTSTLSAASSKVGKRANGNGGGGGSSAVHSSSSGSDGHSGISSNGGHSGRREQQSLQYRALSEGGRARQGRHQGGYVCPPLSLSPFLPPSSCPFQSSHVFFVLPFCLGCLCSCT